MKYIASSRLNCSRRHVGGLLLGSLLLMSGYGIALADPAPPSASAPAVKLNTEGVSKKFTTDTTLRQGMTNIASLLDKSWADIQASRLKGPAYVALGGQVEGEVATIVKNCKLDKRADHALHEIIFDINQSIGLMQRTKPEIQRTGAIALAQALRNYAKYFDHPGWTGPQ